jgi:hypothetical protein
MPLMLLSVMVRTAGGFGIWLHRPSGLGRLQDGPWQERRASTKVTADTQKIDPGHQGKIATLAPLSVIRTEEPVTMREGDWISLAGLVVSVIGFSVVIRELIRIAYASETSQARHQVDKEADPLAEGSS